MQLLIPTMAEEQITLLNKPYLNNIKWNWDGLSENLSISLEWLEKYPDKSWNAYCSFRKSQF